MSSFHILGESKSPYSLIVDLEGKIIPLSVTMSLDIGEVINRLDKEYICIGSGEFLAEKESYNCEEIRAYIARKDDLATVRNIFKIWSEKSSLEDGKEVTIKGILKSNTKSSPIVWNENGDILFSIMSKREEVLVRFIEKNLKFIKGIDIKEPEKLRGVKVYINGLALKKSQKWEIQGRTLLKI